MTILTVLTRSGKKEGADNVRAEIRKISEDCMEFIFGTIPEVDDFYVNVLRCKLYTCHAEKVAFIVDLYGFANNLWNPIEVYKLNEVENYWRVSKYNLDLFHSTLLEMMSGWEIRKIGPDDIYIFDLTRTILHNVVSNHKTHDFDDFTHAIMPFDAKDTKWYYDELKMKELWAKCDNTRSDTGTIAVWFDLPERLANKSTVF